MIWQYIICLGMCWRESGAHHSVCPPVMAIGKPTICRHSQPVEHGDVPSPAIFFHFGRFKIGDLPLMMVIYHQNMVICHQSTVLMIQIDYIIRPDGSTTKCSPCLMVVLIIIDYCHMPQKGALPRKNIINQQVLVNMFIICFIHIWPMGYVGMSNWDLWTSSIRYPLVN